MDRACPDQRDTRRTRLVTNGMVELRRSTVTFKWPLSTGGIITRKLTASAGTNSMNTVYRPRSPTRKECIENSLELAT